MDLWENEGRRPPHDGRLGVSEERRGGGLAE
jgi:hypothetical protein